MKRLLKLSEDEDYIKFKNNFIKKYNDQLKDFKYTLSILNSENNTNDEPIINEFKYLYNKTKFFNDITENDLNLFLEKAKEFDEKMTNIFGAKD